ncbi:MAG: hypothetical protein FGM22_10770 [Burkholderiaceae bacterium]|jgi:hypothetical protein|nr:hypothetical protein [Burkholderiaceae bacterium]
MDKKLINLNPTSRTYPRTMAEAFPDRIEQAEWFYPPPKNTTLSNIIVGIAGVVMWIGLAYLLAMN